VMIGDRHSVPVKTMGAVAMDSYTSSRGVAVSRGAYTVAAGRILHFRLGQPLRI
jgi:hypothetical protein